MWANPCFADFTNNSNSGYFEVDFLNSTAGIRDDNNITYDHVAGTATANAAGAFVRTSAINPSSLTDWDEVRLSGVLGSAVSAQVEITNCTSTATIAGPFSPSGGRVNLRGLGLPSCIQVRVNLNGTSSLDEIRVTWDALPVMLLRLTGDTTDQVGANHCYNLDLSNSFSDNDNIAMWVPLPSGLVDVYGQNYSPSFASASNGGSYTAGGLNLNGSSIPANSVYWNIGFRKGGSTTRYRFCLRTPNGTQDGVSFSLQAEADSPTANATQSDSQTRVFGNQPITTTLTSAPGPNTTKNADTTVNLPNGPVIHNTNGYNPVITYKVKYSNSDSQSGVESIFDPVITDDISDIFAFLGTASPNGCGLGAPASAFTIRDGGVLNTGTAGAEFIRWDFTGSNLLPAGEINVSYDVDFSNCFAVGVTSGLFVDNAVSVIASNAATTSDNQRLFFGIDLDPFTNFSKTHTGGDLQAFGSLFSFQLEAQNTGAVRLDDVILSDMIPADAELSSVSIPPEFNATTFYSTCTTPVTCDDPNTPPPIDYTAAPADIDVGANTFWSPTPPADITTVTWVAFYVPCLSSPFFDSPFPSECHTVNGSPIPSRVSASMQMRIFEPGEPEFTGANSCDPTPINNTGLLDAYEKGADINNADPSVVFAGAPHSKTSNDSLTGIPLLASFSNANTNLTGASSVTISNFTTYTFTVENSGDDTALTTVATIDIPQVSVNGVLEYLSLVSISGGTIDYSGLPSQVTVTLGDIPVNQSKLISLQLFVPTGILNNDTFKVDVSVSATDDDACQTIEGSGSRSTTVSSTPELQVLKVRDESIVSSGGRIHYQLNYLNPGTSPTERTWVVDKVPSRSHFVEAYTAPAVDSNGNTFNCTGCPVYFANSGAPLPPELTPLQPFTEEVILDHFVLGIETSPGVWEPPVGYAAPDEISYIAFLVDDPSASPPVVAANSTGRVGLLVQNDDDGPGGASAGSPDGTLVANSAAIFSEDLLQAIGNLVTTAILPEPSLKVTKSVSDPIVALNQSFSWTIDYVNDSTNISNEVVITDTLPIGISFVSVFHQWNSVALGNGALPAGNTDITANASVSTTANPDGTTTVVITIADQDGVPTDGLRAADLQGFEGGTITINSQAVAPLVTGSLAINTVDGCYNDSTTTICVSDQEQILIRNPDLFLRKLVDQARPLAGETINYTLILSNEGENNASSVEITDTLPVGVCYGGSTSVQTAGWTINPPTITGGPCASAPSTLTWTGISNPAYPPAGTIPGNSEDIFISYSATVDVGVAPGTNLVNNAVATTPDTQDPNFPDNDDEPANVPRPDPFTAKVATSEILPGELISYTVFYGNFTRAPATNVYLIDALPDYDADGTTDIQINSIVPGSGATLFCHNDPLSGPTPTFDPADPLNVANGWVDATTCLGGGYSETFLAFLIGGMSGLQGPDFIGMVAQGVDPDTGLELPTGVNLTNYVEIFADDDEDASNNFSSADTVIPGGDLYIEIDGSTSGILPGLAPGDLISYTVEYGNSGRTELCDIEITTDFDNDLVATTPQHNFATVVLSDENGDPIVAQTVAGIDISTQIDVQFTDLGSGVYQFILGTAGTTPSNDVCLPPGSRGFFKIYTSTTDTTLDSTEITTKATIAENSPAVEAFLLNNLDEDTTFVYRADVTTTKNGFGCGLDDDCATTGDNNEAFVQAGEILQYDITYQNVGNLAAANTILQENIPFETCYEVGSIEANLPAGTSVRYAKIGDGVQPFSPVGSFQYVPVGTVGAYDCEVDSFQLVFNTALPGKASSAGEGSNFSGTFLNTSLQDDEQTVDPYQVQNVSDILPPGRGTGSASAPRVAVDSRGFSHSVFIDRITGSGNDAELWYVKGETGESVWVNGLIAPVDGNPNDSAGDPRVAVTSTGEVYITFHNNDAVNKGSTNGRSDKYLYSSATNSVINLSTIIPGPGGRGSARSFGRIGINQRDEVFVLWVEGNGSAGLDDLYLYRGDTGIIVNLSALIGPGFGTRYPGRRQLRIDSTGNPVVAWEEDNGPRGRRDAFLYDGAVGTVTALSSLLLPGEGFNDTEISIDLELDGGDNKYVAWIEHLGSKGLRDAQFYSSVTGTVTNLSLLLPPGEGTSNAFQIDLAVDGLGNQYIVWSEHNGARGQEDMYFWDSISGVPINLSNMLPGGEGTNVVEDLEIRVDGLGNAYAIWGEQFGARGLYDLYIYSHATGNIVNLSNFLPAGEGTGVIEADPRLEIDASGKPYIFWSEYDGALGSSDQYLAFFDDVNLGIPTITNTSSLEEDGEGTGRAAEGELILQNGYVYATWLDHYGVRGGDDVYLYSPSFNRPSNGEAVGLLKEDVIVNLSDQLPVGEGLSQSLSPEIVINDNGEVFTTWFESVGARGGPDLYLYSQPENEYINISNLLSTGEGDASSFSSNLSITDDGLGRPMIAFVESPGVQGSSDVFLYKHSNRSVINLSSILPPAEGTGSSANPKIFTNNLGQAYVAWAESTGARGSADVYLYSDSSGIVQNLSNSLPLGEGTGFAGTPAITVNDIGTVFVAWAESTGIRGGTDLYLYSSIAGITNLSNSLPAGEGIGNVFRLEIKLDGLSNPLILWSEATGPRGGEDLYLYEGATGVITSITSLLPAAEGMGQVFNLTLETDNAGRPFALWGEANGARGQEDIYLYSSLSGLVTNLSNLLPAGQGTSFPGGLNLKIDANSLATVVWEERFGNRGLYDTYLYFEGTGVVTNLSDLLPAGEGSGGTHSSKVALDNTGNAVVTFGITGTPAGGSNQNLYMYNASSSVLTNLSTQIDVDTDDVSENFSAFDNSGEFYVTWSQGTGTLSERDAFLFGEDRFAPTGTYSRNFIADKPVTAWENLFVDQEIPDNTTLTYSISGTVSSTVYFTDAAALNGVIDISGIPASETQLTITANFTSSPSRDDTPLLHEWFATYQSSQVDGFSFKAQVKNGGFFDNEILNTVSIETSTPEIALADGGAANDDSDVLNIITSNLRLDKSVDLGAASAGQSIVYTIDYCNDGPNNVTNAVVTDTLPANLTYVSDTAGCAFAAPTVTCNLGNLSLGVCGSISITGTIAGGAAAGDVYVNNACIAADQADTDSSDDCDTATTVIGSLANVYLNKSGPIGYDINSNIVYTIDYGNNGNQIAANTVITDTFDTAELTFVGFTHLSGAPAIVCGDSGGGTITCDSDGAGAGGGVNLAVGATGQIQLTFSVANDLNLVINDELIINVAQISTTTTETTITDNTDSTQASPNALGTADLTGVVFEDDDQDARIDNGVDRGYSGVDVFVYGYDVLGNVWGPDQSTHPAQYTLVMTELLPTLIGMGIVPGGTTTGDLFTLTNYMARGPSTSDVSGIYSYSGLVPGVYNLYKEQPTSHAATGSDGGQFGLTADDGAVASPGHGLGSIETGLLADADYIRGIPLATTELSFANNFGMSVTTIGDFVWEDTDGDGIQDVGELGIGGVTVNLLDAGYSTLQVTSTDASGNYSFTVTDTTITYRIQVVAPAGYQSTLSNIGADNSIDSDILDIVFNFLGVSNTFPVVAGTNNIQHDGGLVRPVSISDYVWYDEDRDGIQDAGEKPAVNVGIELLDSGGTVLDTQSTDLAGLYIFEGLTPTNYRIRFTLPTGYSFSPLDAGGDDSLDSDANLVTGETALINMVSGTSTTDTDAGIYRTDSVCAANELGGLVFRDYDANGNWRPTTEPGVPGITVTAYDSAGTALGTDTTDAEGEYKLSIVNGTAVRVEFTNLPTYLENGAAGPNSGTSVTFLTNNSNCDVDLALANPAEYCDATPEIATSFYRRGTPPGGDPRVIDFDYSSGLTSTITNNGITEPAYTSRASIAQVGSIRGLGYHKETDTLVAAAWAKAGVAYPAGPNNTAPDRLHLVYRDGATAPTVFFTQEAGDDNHNYASLAQDLGFWPDAGTTAWGDIDFNEDQSILYAVNLFDRLVYSIPITVAGGIPIAGVASTIDLSTEGALCSNNEWAPGAVSAKDGIIYFSITCTAQTSGLTTDLQAIVVAHDPSGPTNTVVANIDLDYPRGNAIDSGSTTISASWQPWTAVEALIISHSAAAYPHPLAMDIEFDEQGNLLLGLVDMFGARTSFRASTNEVLYSAGDILKLTPSGANWVLNAGDDEHYNSERFPYLPLHQEDETFSGGLSTILGIGEVVAGAYNVAPLRAAIFDGTGTTQIYPTASFTNGVLHMGHSNGARNRNYAVNTGLDGYNSGKNNPIGDVEALCALPPIEIGNRVWTDTDGDGHQDAGESGLSTITVELYDLSGAATLVGTAITAADGTYYFGGITDANMTTGSVLPNTNYEIRIATAQGGLAGLIPTLANNLVGATDLIDSDGVVVGANSVAAITTGALGVNDHSFDFGFTQPASVGNFVWEDLDGDGIQDAGEPGINNVTVELFTSGGVSQGTTTTNASGAYSFTGVIPEAYYIEFTEPAGYIITLLDQGADDAVDSDPDAMGSTANFSLAPGDNNTTIDAGMFRPVSIGNFLWHDLDADGIQDVGEPGIPGHTILLSTAALGVISNTPTNGSGIYSFTGLAPDTYRISLFPPAGFNFSPMDVGADDTIDSDVNAGTMHTIGDFIPSGQTNLTVDIGVFQNASIGDFVWEDLDADGIQDAGETGINNVSVELFNTADVSQGTTTTNAAGAYSFTGLTPGDYYVVFTTPAGYSFSSQDQGADDTVDSDANTTTGRTANYTLTSGENELSADAGMFRNASIGDFVWEDADGDGIQDGGESGLNNVSVELFNLADVSQGTTTTNASGAYSFTGVAPGTYYLVFTTLAGYVFSPQDQGGNDALDSDANTTTGRTANYVLTSNESETSADAGMIANGSVGDFVWEDLDADGIQDVGETGINNVTVELLNSGGGVVQTTSTNPAGAYNFANVIGADYRVRFTLPAGYSFSPQDQGADDTIDSDANTGTGETALFTLGAGASDTSRDAGMFRNASIGDFVWEDTDADGIQDGGEAGVNNVSVELFNTADVSQGTTTTNASGAYSFTGLTPAAYYVVFTAPAGYNFSPQDVGADDTIDSDANTGTGRTANYTLTSGETETSADTGMFQNTSIGDFVWDDLDADGIQDAGETGVNNVTVELFNTADVSQGTTTTNAVGAYSFTGLTPADYYLVFTTPAGYNFSLQDQGADDTVDSDANTTTGRTANYTLTSGETETSADTGMYRDASIGNFVWDDLDADGIQDAGETVGIGGITVELFNAADISQGTTTTSGAGSYSFTGLTPGDYYLVFTPTAGNTISPQDQGGDDSLDSDANTTTGRTANYTLTSGEVDTSADVGLFKDVGIGNFVWEDLDADGILDAGETGINNVSVELFNAADVSQGTTTTNAAGVYDFTGLTPGEYYVVFTTPAGFNFSPQDAGADDTIDSDANTGTGRTANYSLISGEVETSADAGMFQNASIGDFVFDDLDADGIQDAGETGVNNVTVELFNAADVSQGTTTTNAVGAYSFTGLTPADYYVVFTTPAGFSFSPQDTGADDAVDSDANVGTGQTANYVLTSGESETSADAGMFQSTTLGDFVWDDLDANGIQDAGETGINNVSVELFNTADVSQGTTTTNASGAYSFTNLTPGDYYVVFTLPVGYSFSPLDAGGDDTVDSDTNTTTGRTTNYTITSGNSINTVDAGMFQDSSIGDFVWDDLDADGIQDAGETGINNVSVELFNAADVSQGTTTTNAAGAYSFTGLTPADYYVVFTAPAGYNFSPQDVGADDTIDSDANTGTGRTANYTLTSGETETTADAGMFQNASIGDFVWDDLDADGIQDAGETGINNISVELFNAADVSQGTTTTNAAGAYSFTGLTPADYYLVFTTPAGFNFSPQDVGANDAVDSDANTGTGRTANYTLTSGEAETSADAGMFQNASIGDFVWDDLDADGIQDGGEVGVNNVSLELFNAADISQGTTTTNAAGAYSFTGLTPGDYYLVFTTPAGFSFSPQDVGADDAVDSDANTTTGRTANYTLTSGEAETSADAGMNQAGSIGDFVWDDLDADGIQDGGETGLNNVTVELLSAGGAVLNTTTTNAAGAYSFTSLAPANYRIRFTTLAGYSFSPRDVGADDNVDSDPDTGSGETGLYTVTSGLNITNADAGMFTTATISDFVWDDLDADGVQDAGETGIDNVSIELFNTADVSQGTTTTNAAGAYSFAGLNPGDYYLVFTTPAGFNFSPQDVGADDAVDSDANTTTGRTADYTLTSGETETSADAGMFQNASIGDFVWDDLDADGIQDAGETGINNVSVELFNAADVSQGTTTTNAAGAYSFTGLTPADYYVVFTTPAGFNFSPQDVGADDAVDSDANTTTGRTTNYTLTSGETETSADAGMFQNASIGDFVWDDLDADGIQDAGETGINNVSVELFNAADVSQGTTTTNAAGAYSFTGLTPADYYVVFTTPAGFNFSPQDVGADDAVDSDTNTTTGRTANYTLTSGESENFSRCWDVPKRQHR